MIIASRAFPGMAEKLAKDPVENGKTRMLIRRGNMRIPLWRMTTAEELADS
jgi:hypothetical protein